MEGEAGRCWGDNYKVRASLMAQTVENLLQCRRPRFDPWVWKISWRRKWLLTPIFLPREFQGQRSLAGCCPQGHTESDTTEAT